MRVWNPLRQIEITFEGEFFREIGKLAVHFHCAAPVPLTDRRKFGNGRTRLPAKKLRVHERIERLPAKSRFWQSAIAAVNIEPDGPELIVIRLAHLQLGHPIKNFARIEVAENFSLELQEERRMNRVTEIQQRIWPGQPIKQSLFRHPDATHA